MAIQERIRMAGDTGRYRRGAADAVRREIDAAFFELYAETKALSKSSRKPGEAITFFHESKAKLERELKLMEKGRECRKVDDVSIRHGLLALIHWLFPNYIGYNRLLNAKLMYQHALAASTNARTKSSLPYAVGLMVQLRIAPFLIKEKKLRINQLERIRSSATKTISGYGLTTYSIGLAGLVNDGIGFSYFLLERDPDTALGYLREAVDLMARHERALTIERSAGESSFDRKTELAFFRSLLSAVHWDYGICCESKYESSSGELMQDLLKETRFHYQKAHDYAKHTSWDIYKALSAHNIAGTLAKEASVKLERNDAIECLKKAVDFGEESLRWFELWSPFEGDFLGGSWIANIYQQLANYSEPAKRKRLMARSLELARRAEQIVSNRKIGLVRYKLVNIGDIFFYNSEYHRNLAIQTRNTGITRGASVLSLLNGALENCQKSRLYYRGEPYKNRMLESSLLAGDICYELMSNDVKFKQRYSNAAKRYFGEATKISSRLGSNEKVAESCWRIAQVMDKEGNFAKSADSYLKARESYRKASGSTGVASIYSEPADYMLAWSQIEQAKIAHRASEFEQASRLYSSAADLIASTRRWKSRANLYVAQSLIEKSELESLQENQSSIQHFVDAVQALAKLQTELGNEEKQESQSFLNLSARMTSFCNARIILEKSKESYRKGDMEQSIKGLTLAEEIFSELASDSEASDPLGSNELGSLAALCKALVSFQSAQVRGNSELYLEAENIFRRAYQQSKSKTLKSLLGGLSNFATFLYYSKQIEESLDFGLDAEKIVECNKALDSAVMAFKRVGNKFFLNMLKASKHILDATMKMNAAEREVENPQTKAELYSHAQKSLSRASKYYELLGSSVRVKESLRMIGAVRNHQKLIPLAHDIIADIASNQIIYTAISSASLFEESPENSARELDSAFVVMDLSTRPFVSLNENIVIDIVLTNMGKQEAITVRIDEVIPDGLELLEGSDAVVKDRSLLLTRRIAPGQSLKLHLIAKPESTGEYVWHPAVVFLDGERNYKISRAPTAKIVVESDKLADISVVLLEKSKLEEELRQMESGDVETGEQARIEKVYSIREDISKIEESLLRFKNEYVKMKSQLQQIKEELGTLSTGVDNLRSRERNELESEQKMLSERIERRRALLEQAQLL